MSNIHQAFNNKKAFIGFITGGDGGIDASVSYILEMERAGASLVEIGIPFSDPIAEGPVIQRANLRALSIGITIHDMFTIVKKVREVTNIPLVFLTYLNPVFHYGYDSFFKKCKEHQVDGIIIPDLPYEEKAEVEEVSKVYDVDLISLIAPTSKERMQMIAKEAKGFIYLVSSLGVTGMRSQITTNIEEMITSIKEVTDIPIAVGFGINTPKQVEKYTKIADGVIVGSAIVNIVEEHARVADKEIYKYVKNMVKVI
ncbi:MAG: tryptophan synthase subunit alpha [Coprobacillaceae bacterium]